MKKFIINFLSISVILTGSAFGQGMHRTDDIYVADYGANNSATIQKVLTAKGSAPATLVFNRGAWTVTNNLNVSSNYTLKFIEGSYWNVASSYTCAWDNVKIDAGAYTIVSGSGTVTGSFNGIYRVPEWGATGTLQIGAGDLPTLDYDSIQAWIETNKFASLSATNGTFDNLTADNITAGTITQTNDTGTNTFGNLHVNGDFLVSSNDLNVAYLGYPRVALSTGMVSSLSSGGTVIDATNFLEAFDSDLTTGTSEGLLGVSHNHSYIIDLTNSYNGYMLVRYEFQQQASVNVSGSFGSSVDALADNGSGGFKLTVTDNSLGGNAPTTNNFFSCIPVNGRYINFGFSESGGSGDGDYTIYEMLLYGSTNNTRNIGGW